MGVLRDVDLVVKHTFLEYVERPQKLTRARTFTDSALLDKERCFRVVPTTDSPQALLEDSRSDVSTDASSRHESLDVVGPLPDSVVAAECRQSDSRPDQAHLQACCSPQLMPAYEYPSMDMPSLPYDGGSMQGGFVIMQGFTPSWILHGGMGMAQCAPVMACDVQMQGQPAEEFCTAFVPAQSLPQTDDHQHMQHSVNAFSTERHVSGETRTTVMLRNLPNSYTRRMLLELLDSEGFAGRYDFVYLPVDFSSFIGLGYAFVDLVTPSDATELTRHFEGFSDWVTASDKVCTVTWSSPHQGLEQHIERYRNSPVMHGSIPEEWKPVLLKDGRILPFPGPTKHIKPPKLRIRPEHAQRQ